MTPRNPSPQEAGQEFKSSLGYMVKLPSEQRAAVLTKIPNCWEQRMLDSEL